MPITDYNKEKTCEVTSTNDSGSTISKAQPVILVDGDESTTGTGDVVIDFANVADAQDLAMYDKNENLLDYEIENEEDLGGDPPANPIVVWVYNDWVRDDSAQLKVAYGSNSANTDRQNVTGTWDNTAQNTIMVQHLEDSPITATDSTSNNNDGTVTGTTSVSGQFNGAADFDGTDDEIQGDLLTQISYNSAHTMVAWANFDSSSVTQAVFQNTDGSNDRNGFETTGNGEIGYGGYDGSTTKGFNTTYSTNTDYQLVGTNDGSFNLSFYVDGSQVTTGSYPGLGSGTGYSIGSRTSGSASNQFMDGTIDEVRAYSEQKSAAWIQADYDASPKAGQVFFSQQAAENNATTKSVTSAHDAAIANLDQSVTLTTDTVAQHRQNGNVTLDGSAVQGAEVHCYNITQQVNIGHDQTDSNGNYQIDPSNVGDVVSGDKLMIATYFEQGDGDDFGQVKVTVV